jgi:hypothetical protein
VFAQDRLEILDYDFIFTAPANKNATDFSLATAARDCIAPLHGFCIDAVCDQRGDINHGGSRRLP